MSSNPSFHWQDPVAGPAADRRRTHGARRRPGLRAGQAGPRVLNAFRNEQTDPAIFSEMGELGLLGATIPAEYGGAGLNYVSYGLIAREVERVDSGYRSMMSVQSSLVMVPINEFGSEAQKQKYLPKLARGEWIGCFGLTEPNSRFRPRRHGNARGQDRRRLQADRQQDVDHQLPIADVFVVWAKCVGGDFDGRSAASSSTRHEGPVGPGHPRQGRPARLDHRRNRHGRSGSVGRADDARRGRPEEAPSPA